MSSEFQYNFSLTCTNGNFRYSFVKGNGLVDQANQGQAGGVVDVTTSAANLDMGSISTNGLALFHNLDLTHYVDIGLDATGFKKFIRLYPDQFAFLPLASGFTPQAQANIATIKLEYAIFEK